MCQAVLPNEAITEQQTLAAMSEASQPVASSESPLQGKRVVFTGTLTTMSRHRAKLLLCQVGGYRVPWARHSPMG